MNPQTHLGPYKLSLLGLSCSSYEFHCATPWPQPTYHNDLPCHKLILEAAVFLLYTLPSAHSAQRPFNCENCPLIWLPRRISCCTSRTATVWWWVRVGCPSKITLRTQARQKVHFRSCFLEVKSQKLKRHEICRSLTFSKITICGTLFNTQNILRAAAMCQGWL